MTTPTTLRPSQVLSRAADLVDFRGLIKDDWIDPGHDDEDTCPICLLAAINIAAGQDHDATLEGIALDAAGAVAAFLGLDHLLLDADSPHDAYIDVLGNGWNDVPERTAGEVVRVLRAAAKREQEVGR